MSIIRFTINYRTNHKQKVENFLDNYTLKAGIKIQDLKIERYWKEKGQMQATFQIKSDLIRIEEKTFEILMLANLLAATNRHHHWTINGPNVNGHLTFGCILNNGNKDEPLTWANIEWED